MDNQQPSLEQRKVQRLSHKGVLNNVKSYIIWEKPHSQNKIYLYKLCSSENDEIRYIGITNNPNHRLSQHLTDKDKSHKRDWIQYCIKNNYTINMIIFEMFDNLNDALKKEEYYINYYNNLTNYCLTPTTPNYKKCFLYDLFTSRILEFDSLSKATKFIEYKSPCIYKNKVLKGRYLFSYTDNFKDIIEEIYTIKIKKENNIIKCVSYQHASKIIGCSINMINMCLIGLRNNYKGSLITYKENNFPELKIGKKVRCINDNKIYNSLKSASEYYNIDLSCITKVCKNKRKTVKGLKFEYFD